MVNYEANFKPIEKLTAEIIDNLILHQTVSSLRRAASVSPKIIRVEATEDYPTLFYIKGSRLPSRDDWTIHALVPDVLKFLLKGTVSPDPGPEPPGPDPDPDPDKPEIKSNILLDQPVVGPDAIANINDGYVTITGAIKWNTEDEPNPGNYACILVTPDPKMLEAYPDAIVTSDLGTDPLITLMDGEDYLEVCYPVFEVGQEFVTTIKWSNEFEEVITIKVDENCVLESA
jgi:hypothetical protein